jgi:hypothetical protein
MSKIERGESVVSTPVKRRISMEELCAKFKILPSATAYVVGANGAVPLTSESVIVAEWTETTMKKPRARNHRDVVVLEVKS